MLRTVLAWFGFGDEYGLAHSAHDHGHGGDATATPTA